MKTMPNLFHEDIRRILIIQIRAIGDVVLTTPVLPVLKRHFHRATIDFVTGTGIGAILQGLPEINHVIEIQPYADIRSIWHTIRQIRSRQYDLVIDFQGTNTPAMITYFSGAPFRLGWQRVRRRWAYNRTGSAKSEAIYVPFQKCQLLNAIGIQEENWKPRIAIPSIAKETVQKYLAAIPRALSSPKINISVSGKRQTRRWFPDRWAYTIDLLQEKTGALVFLNATPSERPYVENVAAMCRTQPYILPQWDLATFAAYIAEVDLHLSYDNGVKHLAVAVDTPSLTFYGSANPVHWHPPETVKHQFIYPEVACRGCGRLYCGAMICMETILPEDVLTIVKNMLSQNTTVMV